MSHKNVVLYVVNKCVVKTCKIIKDLLCIKLKALTLVFNVLVT